MQAAYSYLQADCVLVFSITQHNWSVIHYSKGESEREEILLKLQV